MITVGIDIGFDGAIAFNSDGKITEVQPMPTLTLIGGKTKKGNVKHKRVLDLLTLKLILEQLELFAYSDHLVVIEKLQGMPNQSSVATFSLGEQYGIVQGLLTGLGLKYIVVRPQEWKKKILKGYDTKSKGSSVLYCKRKYPNVPLKSGGQRVDKDGFADAICLSEYAISGDKEN